MNDTRRAIAAFLAAGLTTAVTAPLAAEDFFQDFRTDCSLEGWEVHFGTAQCTPEGVEIRNTGGRDAGIASPAWFEGDIAVLLRASFNNTTRIPSPRTGAYPHIFVDAHWSTPGDNYYGNVSTEGRVALRKWVGGDGNNPPGATLVDPDALDFDIDLAEELALELRLTEIVDPSPGKEGWYRAELRIWRPDDSRSDLGRPAEPVIAWEDATPMTAGQIGIGGFVASDEANPILLYSVQVTQPDPARPFLRGDANGDAKVNVSDGIQILLHLFSGTVDIECEDAADVNDDGEVGIDDAIRLLNYLFADGPSMPTPGPKTCGPDETEDDLPDCWRALCP